MVSGKSHQRADGFVQCVNSLAGSVFSGVVRCLPVFWENGIGGVGIHPVSGEYRWPNRREARITLLTKRRAEVAAETENPVVVRGCELFYWRH